MLEYVGRYTHRVAISNDRILSLENADVTFVYKRRPWPKNGQSDQNRHNAIRARCPLVRRRHPQGLKAGLGEPENNVISYKGRKKGTMEQMTIDAVEFIRRFLLHVLPKKFMRIRHIGLLANRWKKDNLKICRSLLGVAEMPNQEAEKSVVEMMQKLTGRDITLCRKCGKGHFAVSQKLPRRTGVNPFFIIHAPAPKRSG